MEPTPLAVDSPRSGRALDEKFSEFVRVNVPVLVRSAGLLSGSGLSAEDLVQDTLVRLYPSWGQVEDADVPLAYVRRSLTNNFLNHRRKGTHREIVTDVVPDRPDRCSTEGDVADRDEVRRLLGTLGRRQRTALVLRFYEGRSDAEIADRLGCRPGTVRSLVSRSLATLRQRPQPA